ncbi:nucleotidyltransferase family protein [Paracoccus sp. NSM]|uniref:nucleotidyltransferase family protein n=1 Tax=Paracoccus sp. NSM TaxID=3457784 RepID=UPI0040368884
MHEGGTTALLLAAGASRRFGAEDKLIAHHRGQPLIAHGAAALRATRLAQRIAVIANPALIPHLAGFRIVTLPPGTAPLHSTSLRAGLAAAGQPDRLLIALGDMPGITPAHLQAIIDRTTPDRPAASTNGRAILPPACFPRAVLPRLAALTGDRGAASLLRDLPEGQLILAPDLLADIDSPGDLAP